MKCFSEHENVGSKVTSNLNLAQGKTVENKNGISLLRITGYTIIEVDGKYVMVEMLLSTVPFGDVKHTGDTILRASKQELTVYGVGQYECSFTTSDNEIVLVDTVLPCVHMKVTDDASNISI